MDIKLSYKLNLHKKIAIPSILAVIIIFAATYFLVEVRENRLILDSAYRQARTAFRMIVVTRQWAAEKQGEMKPEPEISAKELSIYAKQLSDIRFHITSDHPINPGYAPDKFEKTAMKQFGKGKKEIYRVVDTKNGEIYQYMAPLYISKACMRCHIYRNYHIGDFIGGISVSIPLAPIYSSISRNKKILLGFIAVMGLLFLLLIKLLITRLVLIPISKLDSAASKILHGNYNVDIKIHSSDELGALAKTFNNMSKKIAFSQTELQNKVKDSTKELKMTNEKLNKLAARKSELYSALAHDIRTPLAVITLGSENIKAKCDKTEDIEIIQAIKRNAQRLKALFDNLLEIEKIESTVFKIYLQKEDINSILQEVVAELTPFAKHSRISLIFDYNDKLEAIVDKDKLSVCFRNIITNAIKFSPFDTQVTINCYEIDRRVVIEIGDHGIGIASDEMDKIFNKFYRTERGRQKHLYGTGLGLAITKKFIDAMGGKIYVTSKPNIGTQIKIVLRNK